ncbi:MAG: maleylpyruvate isomerase N-terminal domain-containing protein [Chloroflexota bacterium]
MPCKPSSWINACTATHRRIEQVVSGLTDAHARRPSLLPGWTIGHVLTHLARNADANTGMVLGAQRGEICLQYPGGTAQREADIARGQGRPAAALMADLAGAHERLEAAWASTSEDAWATGLARTTAALRSVAHTVYLRWREAEVHLVDLGLGELGGPDWDGLSAAYVDAEWAEMTAVLPRRVPEGSAMFLIPGDRPSRVFGTGDSIVRIQASPGRVLQYLLGRGGEPGWPSLPAWG